MAAAVAGAAIACAYFSALILFFLYLILEKVRTSKQVDRLLQKTKKDVKLFCATYVSKATLVVH